MIYWRMNRRPSRANSAANSVGRLPIEGELQPIAFERLAYMRPALNRFCLLLLLLLCAGCVSVGPNEQRLVSKPNMVFSQSAVFNYQNTLLQQMEPGSTFSGGAVCGGCTSCK
jgi:hypothetical protein